MVWPTDDLTTTHLDAGTDDPGQARAEIKACVDKLKTVLGEVSSGATVWHSGNDGGGSGLDSDLLDGQHGSYYRNASNINAGKINNAYVNTGAGNGLDSDLLDGQHGSYYQNASNLTSGTLSMSRIGTDAITSDKIGSNAVGQSELGPGAVHQSEMDTSTESDSTSSTSGVTFILTAGSWALGNHTNYISGSGSTGAFIANVGLIGEDVITITTTKYSYLTMESPTGITLESTTRYINSSPPYDLGDGEIALFTWARLNSNGEIVAIQASESPPWAYNGPTNITPSRVEKNGDKFRTIRTINEETGAVDLVEELITMEIKNRDMELLPHPFASLDAGDTVVLLDPPDMLELSEIRKAGESVNELLHSDYLRLDNTPISRCAPTGVMPCKFKWKNTNRRSGEMLRDRRLKQGPYAEGVANANNSTN